MKKINGLIAATFSTFKTDGSLDLSPIPELVEKMVADGLSGIFICGTNGEGPNMTTEERMAVAEAYVKASRKRLLVLVHVGHNAILESKKLAAHAQQIGADAISSVAGFYFKPSSVENLVSCMQEIAAAAPLLPFYYYHIPSLTGVNMDMLSFLRLGEKAIPNLAGIKYSATTLYEYQACLNYKEQKFDILYGYDEMLLSALAVGARGAIGSTYTFAAPLYNRVIGLFQSRELPQAQELQLKLVDMIRTLLKFSPIPGQKSIMKYLGTDLGPCRLPLKDLLPQEAFLLQDELEKQGFFQLLQGVGKTAERPGSFSSSLVNNDPQGNTA